jgi:hypothetical protein
MAIVRKQLELMQWEDKGFTMMRKKATMTKYPVIDLKNNRMLCQFTHQRATSPEKKSSCSKPFLILSRHGK